jgi:hypothetical protein
MIKENEQKIPEESSSDIYRELFYLKDECYFRQQVLTILDKMSVAMERQAMATEKLLVPSLEGDKREEDEVREPKRRY